MKIALTTLGCPNWDWDTICARGREYGFDGVDMRGYLGAMDITLMPEFTTGAGETRKKLEDHGLVMSAISSSIRVCVAEQREANIEEAKRTIDVAGKFDVKNVRVFGGGDLNKTPRAELAKIGCDCVEAILQLDGASGIQWLFETHDIWVKGDDCRLLLEAIPNPNFGALWDIGHTPRVGGEAPEYTYNAMQGRVGYVHLKDAVYDPADPKVMQDGWVYRLPGQGALPLIECLKLLHSKGYTGWIQFEHEKRWHPELQEPEEAFPAFVNWIRPVLASL